MFSSIWEKIFPSKKLFPEPEADSFPDSATLESKLKIKIKIEKSSITKISADAIVNSAGRSLIKGGGVDWAIHQAAGKELQEDLNKFGGCEEGATVVTKGYRLPCEYVIHTVTPVWITGETFREDLLRSCYQNIFSEADRLGLRTLAIPAIGTGVHEIPIHVSADIVREELLRHYSNRYEGSVEEIVFAITDADFFNTYTVTFDKTDVIIHDHSKINTWTVEFSQKKLTLNGNFVVNVVPSKINKIAMHVQGLDITDIDVTYEADTLILDSPFTHKTLLHVSCLDLAEIQFEGEGSITYESEYRKQLDIEIRGDIDLNLIGIFDNLNIKAMGDGSINAQETSVKVLDIHQQGMHEISANATELLKLRKEGFGNAYFHGSPKTVETLDEGIGLVQIL